MTGTHKRAGEGRPTLRSLLFIPGTDPIAARRPQAAKADAIVFDLEDMVALSAKETARRETARALAATPAQKTSTGTGPDGRWMVRINGLETEHWFADLEAVVTESLFGVIVPKVEAPSTLREVDDALTGLERREGFRPGGIRLFPLLETARGVVLSEEIAMSAPERTCTLCFGPVDLARDLEVDLDIGIQPLRYARARLVMAARAGGLQAPVDGPYMDTADPEGLRADSLQSRRIGYQGRILIDAVQVDPANEAYSEDSEAALNFARKVVEAFEAAEAEGKAAVTVDGQFVDYPVYRDALRRLNRSQ